MAGELLPGLIILPSDAQITANQAVNDAWVETMGKVKGKYGHKFVIERLPYVAVRKSGSMDSELFMESVEQYTFDLYPEETVSLDIEFDPQTGELIKGPVMWNCDMGPGRISSNKDIEA